MKTCPHLYFSRTAIAVVIAASFWLAGCGHHRGAASPGREIAIPLFENATFEPTLNMQATQAVKEAFLTRGFQITGASSGAPTILTGKINSFEKTPISLGATGLAMEYRIKIGAEITLRHRGEETTFTAEETAEFFAHSDTLLHRAAEDRAIRETSRRLAERVADLLFIKSHSLGSTKQ